MRENLADRVRAGKVSRELALGNKLVSAFILRTSRVRADHVASKLQVKYFLFGWAVQMNEKFHLQAAKIGSVRPATYWRSARRSQKLRRLPPENPLQDFAPSGGQFHSPAQLPTLPD